MISETTQRFRKAYSELPPHIKEATRKAYKLWQLNSAHGSLQFKQIHKSKPIYSVRIGLSWRALGVKSGNTMIWFWIGSHSDYNNLVNSI